MPKKVTKKWCKLLSRIPGYDPFRDAGKCYFDPDAAQHVIDVFHNLFVHIEGSFAGKHFLLELWQQSILANVFGWKRPDGMRRYREVFVYIPRKNGKTPFGAGILNYVLFFDNEPGAQIYGAAGEKEQAALLYRHATGMISREEELSSRCKVYRAFKSIQLLSDPGSTYKVLSADADTKHGGNPHLVILDELHVQKNRELVDVFTTSFASEGRKQPLFISFTTADFEREGSICNEKHDYAKKVRDGIIKDDAFLPVIYEATLEDDWTDPKVWKRVNPNLGVSVSMDYLKRACAKAKEMTSFENTFKRLHLNIRTEQAMRWLKMDKWDACNAPVDEKMLEGKECYMGLDLASNKDVAAAVMLFPADDGSYDVVPRFWIPRDNAAARDKRDRVPYTAWARDGYITMTEGDMIDYDVIRRDICELGERFNILEISIDRWAATHLITQLSGDGHEMVPFGNGFHDMNAPTQELEVLVCSGRIRHGGNPVLRWMASNVAIETNATDYIKPSKKKSTEKIDGIVALIMAIGRSLERDENEGRSVYDDIDPERLMV